MNPLQEQILSLLIRYFLQQSEHHHQDCHYFYHAGKFHSLEGSVRLNWTHYSRVSLSDVDDIRLLKTINSILYDFLWDGKGDKIKRTTMINSYAKGGLKMLDIQSFNESLKVRWIQGYLNEENKGKWKLFF